jgi:hypothetical protein
MHSLAKLAATAYVVLFAGFFCVILWKIATGDISLSYLLDGDVRDKKSRDGSGFSATPSGGRAQMLSVTLSVAMWYLLQVIHNPKQFPQLPDTMLGTLAGSHVVYLGAKAQGLFFGRLQDLLK